MLLTSDIQGNASHIALMYRTDYLGYNRELNSLGESDQFVAVSRRELFYQRYLGRFQQSTDFFRIQITAARQPVDNTANFGHVNTIQLYIRTHGLRRVEHTREGCTQRHFIRKVHMTFLHETFHFRTRCYDGWQYRKNRLLALLHFLMKHFISIV